VLIFLVATQAAVYLCAPVAAVWNLFAMRAGRAGRPAAQAARRQRGGVRLPRRVAVVLGAVVIAALASAFAAPSHPLANARTAAPGGPWPQALLASPTTQVFLQVGPSADAAGGVYHRITPVHLAGLGTAQVALAFTTSSGELLGDVLRAAAGDGQVAYASLSFRAPGRDGRMRTRLVDTFAGAVITSVAEPTPASPRGAVSLVLPAAGAVLADPGSLQAASHFATASAAPIARSRISLGQGLPAYAVTGLSLSRSAAGQPLSIGFSTKAPPLLERILQAQNTSTGLPALILSVRHVTGGRPVRQVFAHLRISAFTENLARPFAGTAALSVPVERAR
jgi:hypothetical protein